MLFAAAREIAMDHWEFTKRTGTLFSLGGAVVALSWFCFSTVSRIGTLEAQMQALTISVPARPVAPSAPTVPPPQDAPQLGQQKAGESVKVNPIAQVCAELALRLVEKTKNDNAIGALEPISATMDRLNCKNQR